MKKIKLRKFTKGIRKEIPVYVDSQKVEFQEGLAVVKGLCLTDGKRGDYYGTLYGVINEDFEEAFDDTMLGRNLMFMAYNRKIERFGDKDFVVKVHCTDEVYKEWMEYRHIRVQEGKAVLINNIGSYQKTQDSKVLLVNKSYLYDIEKGKVITPAFTRMEEDKENPGLFKVLMAITGDIQVLNKQIKPVDYVYFKCDKERIVSPVFSVIRGKVDLPEESLKLKDWQKLEEAIKVTGQDIEDELEGKARTLEIK